MEPAYLSDDWFELARTRIEPLLRAWSGGECRVQFDAEHSDGHRRWSMILDGAASELRSGEIEDPHVELHHSLAHAWAVFNEEVNGDDALAGYTVVEERPDGRYVGPAAPMELGEQAELAQLPVIPGASLEVQYEYSRAPFGPVSYFISFVDGQAQSMGLGRSAEPDVVVEATFKQMAQVRHGDMSILDALGAGAKVKGSEGALALLAGISESPEFHRAELACGRSGFVLAAFGELGADPTYSAAMDELRTITGPPDGL